jgi:hypothetical protein
MGTSQDGADRVEPHDSESPVIDYKAPQGGDFHLEDAGNSQLTPAMTGHRAAKTP